MAKSRMHSLEYSTQFKKDFKKVTKLPIPDIVEVGRIISKLQLARIGSHSELF